jgi:stress-induced morphogen
MNRRVEVAMSNTYWDEDDDLDTESQSFGSSESDLLKKLRKAKRADEKRIKELTEQLEGLSKVQRERTVKEVLEKKGVNLKAARLVMKDLDEVNEESVSRWLDDNADLFGLEVARQEVPTQDLSALRQQDILTQGAVTPDAGMDLEQRLNQAGSADEILSLLRSQ